MTEHKGTEQAARKRGPHTSGTWVEPRYDQDQSQYPSDREPDPCEPAEVQAAINQPVLVHRVPGGGHHRAAAGDGNARPHPSAGPDDELRKAERPGGRGQ